MAKQDIEKYYDQRGGEHTVKSEWSFGSFIIYVDGVFHTRADDRLEKREIIDDLVKYKQWSETKPRKRKTPPTPGKLKAE